MMQECYESLLLLEFPIPNPILISRLEPEEELGGPDPNDSKEWEVLRVAPADDEPWSGNDEDPAAPDSPAQAHPALPLSHGIKEAASHFPEAPSQTLAPKSRREKPFQCQDCGKSFTRNSNRNAHQRSHRHSQSIPKGGNAVGRRLPPCSQCGKSFTYGSAFLKHQRKHGQDRAPQHSQPGKSFPGSSGINRHQRSHLG